MIRIPFRNAARWPNLTPAWHLMGVPVELTLRSGDRVGGVIVQQVVSGWVRVAHPDGSDSFIAQKEIARIGEVQDPRGRDDCIRGFNLWRTRK